jgi:uncharacterized UBP type Zn finger protein
MVPAIMNALSSKKMSDIKAWELETSPCTHTQNLVQHESRKLESLGISDIATSVWCMYIGTTNFHIGPKQRQPIVVTVM